MHYEGTYRIHKNKLSTIMIKCPITYNVTVTVYHINLMYLTSSVMYKVNIIIFTSKLNAKNWLALQMIQKYKLGGTMHQLKCGTK